MTWSIIARDPDTGAFGVAISTRFFAVGALCPHASGGVGALSTQALVNPTFGPRGLRLLASGRAAHDVVAELVKSDEGRAHRQLHVIDREGRTAAHTGSACIDWCGDLAGDAFSVAGNMLAGASVIEATAQTYRDNLHRPFADRLIRALEAGEAEGGDKRGKQSAALLIHSTEEYPELSLRVDDHADPLVELRRLEEKSRERFVHFARFLPTREAPAGIFDRAVIEAEIARATAKAES
jgi:uncharacterized Ntn-hydrolase superfamily protein